MSARIKGLSEQEVERSKAIYGDNTLKRQKTKGFFRKFIENLSDPIIRVLMIALAIQIIFTLGNCNFIEIGGIVCAILLSTTVSTISEHRSEKAFERLNAENRELSVAVLRGGKKIKISPQMLVVGDVVYLSCGEKIQADGTLIEGKLTVDQSTLNGESAEIIKRPGKTEGWDLSSECRVFRGSSITEGGGIMVVERVGDKTYYGMISSDIQAQTRISPLKLRLRKLASLVSKIGYVIAALVGLFYLFNSIVVDNGFDAARIIDTLKDYKYMASVLLSALTYMITVIVVAAPEGLPMMITVVLSANMKKMLNDNIHVKKLVGIDTAGSLNILFTDKTGTITEGRPVLDKIITPFGTAKNLKGAEKLERIYDELIISAKYNTDVINIGGELSGGNSTDKAIYEFFADIQSPEAQIAQREPFTSDKKYSLIKLKSGKTYIKGAAEVLIRNASYMLTPSGNQVIIDKDTLYSEYKEATTGGGRAIAVCISNGQISTELVFVALIVLKDKIRKDVIKAVREVKRAGIQTVMITGDGMETAISIAEECEIYDPTMGHLAVSGETLHKMTDDEVKAIIPRLRVVSRALPHDKTRLVRLSQALELVVGMTGDGINDAPSLKLADVGFAMGSGTDIAKSAADIVILDNSYSAIVKTVLYGRTIFKSIRKFITFQLTMNFAACGVSLVGQFIGIDTPITIIQMLWVNIIMDTLGGLAFAGEAPLPYYMKEKPICRTEPILSKESLRSVFVLGAFTLGICTLFLTSPIFKNAFMYSRSPDSFYTAFYALFIFTGIFNCFITRCERVWILSNIGKNKLFIFIMLFISVIQIFMIYFGGEVFRCVPLGAKELLFVLSIAFSVIPFDLSRRIIMKLK